MAAALNPLTTVSYLMGKLPLLTGMLLVVASSFYEVFANYVVALKVTFNLSQSEVELLSTVNIAVSISSLVAGAVHDTKGPTVSLLIGMITWSAGAIILAWSFAMVGVIDIPTPVLVCGILLLAHGRTYSFITGLVTMIHSVPAHYRLAASSFEGLVFYSGTWLYALIYDIFFQNGHVLDPENQNPLGFFVMQVCVAIIVHVVSMFGLNPHSNTLDTQTSADHFQHSILESQVDSNCEDELSNSTEKADLIMSNMSNYGSNGSINSHLNHGNHLHKDSGKEISESETAVPKSLWSTIFGIDFLLLALTATLFDTEGLFFSLHIAIFANSLGVSSHYPALITIYRSLVLVGLVFGLVLMWRIRKRHFTFILLQVANMLSLSAYLCLAFAMTQVWSLYFSSVTIGLGFGLFVAIFAGVVDDFGSRYLGTLFGIVTTAEALALIIIQPTFGALYTSHIHNNSDSIYCFGPECLSTTIWIFVSLGIISNGACIALLICKNKRLCAWSAKARRYFQSRILDCHMKPSNSLQ